MTPDIRKKIEDAANEKYKTSLMRINERAAFTAGAEFGIGLASEEFEAQLEDCELEVGDLKKERDELKKNIIFLASEMANDLIDTERDTAIALLREAREAIDEMAYMDHPTDLREAGETALKRIDESGVLTKNNP